MLYILFRSAAIRSSAVVVAIALRATTATGAEWKVETSIGVRATLTDNVGLNPPGEEDADFYTQITPAIRATRNGARLRASVAYAPSAFLYASSSEENSWAHSLAATANLEAVPDFFFVDASATVSQTFLTPFGALPVDLGNVTENRTEAYGLTVSPYIRGQFGQTGSYEVRNRTSYAATDSDLTNGSTYVSWSARASAEFTQRLGWTLQASRNVRYFYDQDDELVDDIARALLTYQINSDLSVQLRGGYESNNYSATNRSSTIYGLGIDWALTARTRVSGYVEERFFGTGYNATATHRRRISAITLYASRDISSYPQLLFTLPPGDTRSLLDAALTARIPDPAQRQALIEQLIALTGTPSTLQAFTDFYTDQVTLIERIGGSIALLGVRNSVILSASWVKSEPISQITGQPLPPELTDLNRFISYGGAINWSYRLTARSRLNLLLSHYYTEKIDNPDDNSTNDLARLELSTNLSPRTTGSVGVRFARFDSNLFNDSTEHAIFAAANHRF